jgi:chemotaxis protein histidine kinase CheA
LDITPATPRSAISFRLADARNNLDHDEELMRGMAAIFIDDVPAMCVRLAAMCQAIKDGRMTGDEHAAELRHVAHSLKGLAATFGAEPLRELAGGLEEASAAGMDAARIAECDADVVRNGGWVKLGVRTAESLAAALGMATP